MVQRTHTKRWEWLNRGRTNTTWGPRTMSGPPNLPIGMSCIEEKRTNYRGWHILATQQRSYYIYLQGDWLLTERESRDNLGEWLKKTQVRHQDQRRMLESIMYWFPSNFWRNKITRHKESDKWDLCKKSTVGIGGKLHHRKSSPNPDLGTHPAYLWSSLRTPHDGTTYAGVSYTESSHA